MQCDFCNLKGHVKDNCYKLVAHPPNYNKKRFNSGGGQGRTYYVQTKQSSMQDIAVNQGQDNQVVANVTELYQRQEYDPRSQITGGMQVQPGACVFSRE